MEFVINISSIGQIAKLKELNVDGIIAGSRVLSSRYNFSLDELAHISKLCKEYGLKFYVDIDVFIKEENIVLLEEYLEFITNLNPDGIYFLDLSVYSIALSNGYLNKLIYNPGPLMTNTLDVLYYLEKGLDSVVLARELTLDEILKIAKNTNNQVDVQIGGHLMMSKSERLFISNYLEHINSDIKIDNQHNYYIMEETRDRLMPIKETHFGTEIYTDYILCVYRDYLKLKKYIKRAIIDSIYLDDEVLYDLIRGYKQLEVSNIDLTIKHLEKKYPDLHFEDGYFYNKTLIKKEANND